MTFGISRGVAQDDAGNVQPNVWVEVRRMAPGFPLAVPLYADANGATTLDNPFFCASGEFEFYAVGFTYRVHVYKTGFEKTWDDVPVGTAQGVDIDAYATAGFTWAPESATATPPSDGCIRFNNADVSLATHVYLDQNTLGGSDATTWLSFLTIGDWLLLSTGVGIEVGWKVSLVTHVTSGGNNYFDITVDNTSYAGPAGPLSLGDSGFVTVAQQRNGVGMPAGGTTGQFLKKNSNADYDTGWVDPGSAGTESTITTASTVTVGDGVAKVFVSLASPGTVTLNLGKATDRGGLALVVVDMVGNATIVLNANVADTGGINGASSAQINSSGAGFGLAGGATFYPKASLNGWAGIA